MVWLLRNARHRDANVRRYRIFIRKYGTVKVRDLSQNSNKNEHQSTSFYYFRVTLDMLSVQGNIKKAWHEKINKLFWRGRDSSRERLHLITLSRQHNDIINASLTDFFFFRDQQEKYGPKEKRISFFDFFDVRSHVFI